MSYKNLIDIQRQRVETMAKFVCGKGHQDLGVWLACWLCFYIVCEEKKSGLIYAKPFLAHLEGVREIGEFLNKNGGTEKMLIALKYVPTYYHEELRICWDGIGNWKYAPAWKYNFVKAMLRNNFAQ